MNELPCPSRPFGTFRWEKDCVCIVIICLGLGVFIASFTIHFDVSNAFLILIPRRLIFDLSIRIWYDTNNQKTRRKRSKRPNGQPEHRAIDIDFFCRVFVFARLLARIGNYGLFEKKRAAQIMCCDNWTFQDYSSSSVRFYCFIARTRCNYSSRDGFLFFQSIEPISSTALWLCSHMFCLCRMQRPIRAYRFSWFEQFIKLLGVFLVLKSFSKQNQISVRSKSLTTTECGKRFSGPSFQHFNTDLKKEIIRWWTISS